MSPIDFRTKINWHRRFRSPQGDKSEHEILRIFESDRGRIINSPAIRRLQQKTQVFPLERNAAVRTRLTHSMEVQQVGRYIAKEILSRLKEQRLLETYGLDELTGPFESIVEMACLMHDIGNPPFGHFGESAIQNWFANHLKKIRYSDHETLHDVLSEQQRNDLYHYEGNAQSLRIITKLHRLSNHHGMHLTSGVMDTIIKYPCSSSEKNAELTKPKEQRSLLRKKHSYFASEEKIYQKIKENTCTFDCRNPLTFILEAADDLAYTFSDLEDGYNKGLYSFDELRQLLRTCNDENGLKRLDTLFAKFQSEGSSDSISDPCKQAVFNWLTAKQLYCISQTSRAFIANYDDIMNGTFEKELLAVCTEANVIAGLKKFAFDRVYQTRSIIKLELMGNEIISFLLDRFVDALLPFDSEKEQSEIQEKYCRLLSSNYIENYYEEVRDITQDKEKVYYRLLLAADFIAGMTDTYAKTLYQEIKGIAVLNS